MGYNTTILVLNDTLHTIERDRDFGKKVADAIRSIHYGYEKPIGISVTDGKSIHCDAASVIETHHADTTAIIAIGKNYGKVLNYCTEANELDAIQAIESIAYAHGLKVFIEK